MFGLTNALSIPVALTDARLVIVAFTLLVAALALGLAGPSNRRRLRVVQLLFALPFGALPLSLVEDRAVAVLFTRRRMVEDPQMIKKGGYSFGV